MKTGMRWLKVGLTMLAVGGIIRAPAYAVQPDYSIIAEFDDIVDSALCQIDQNGPHAVVLGLPCYGATMIGDAADSGVVPLFVPGASVEIPIPPVSTPYVPGATVPIGTPAVTVPRACAGTLVCVGPVHVMDEGQWGSVTSPTVEPIPVTPPMKIALSVSDISGDVGTVYEYYTLEPIHLCPPNPFGACIPVDICEAGCSIPIVTSGESFQPTVVSIDIDAGPVKVKRDITIWPNQ